MAVLLEILRYLQCCQRLCLQHRVLPVALRWRLQLPWRQTLESLSSLMQRSAPPRPQRRMRWARCAQTWQLVMHLLLLPLLLLLRRRPRRW